MLDDARSLSVLDEPVPQGKWRQGVSSVLDDARSDVYTAVAYVFRGADGRAGDGEGTDYHYDGCAARGHGHREAQMQARRVRPRVPGLSPVRLHILRLGLGPLAARGLRIELMKAAQGWKLTDRMGALMKAAQGSS